MTDSGGQPHGAGGAGPETNAFSAMRRIRDELDLLQESLSVKDSRLNEREEQLNALAARLEAKNRELAALNDLINKEREKLQAKDAELRKQEGFVSRARDLEEALRKREASVTLRERAMRRTLEALKRQAREVDQQRRELRRSALRSHPALLMEPREQPAAWRVPLAVVLAVLVGAGVYAAIRPTYLIRAAWERTDGGELSADVVRKALSESKAAAPTSAAGMVAAILADGPGTRWTGDKEARLVSLAYRTGDPAGVGRVLNVWGPASLGAIEQAERSDSSPDESSRLARRRDDLRRELSRTTAPANSPSTATAPSANSAEALSRRVDELASSREDVHVQLSAVRARLAEVATRPADAVVAEDVRSEAQAADPELSQARRRMKDGQEAVRSLLMSAFAAAQPKLGEMRRALDELIKNTNTQRQNPPDAEAAGELDAIHNEAAKLKDRLGSFAKEWSDAMADLKETADPIAAQRAIETSVKEYVAASAAAMASLERNIQAIGEGGLQITKRFVVRAALTKTLRRVTDAHRELVERIDDATAEANFRLEAALQTADGSAKTIAARISVIDASLRERAVSQAKQERQRQADELRKEEETLAAKAAELTDALVPAQQALQDSARRWLGRLEQTERRQEAERQRSRLRDELAQVEDRLAVTRREAGGKAVVHFVPASYSPEPVNRFARIGWGSLAAVAVLVIGIVLLNPTFMVRLRWLGAGMTGLLVRRGELSDVPELVVESNGQPAQPSDPQAAADAEKKQDGGGPPTS